MIGANDSKYIFTYYRYLLLDERIFRPSMPSKRAGSPPKSHSPQI